MVEIQERIKDGWLYFINLEALENKNNLELEMKKLNHGSIGKYLFFSDDKGELIKLAKLLLNKYNLFNAKVPLADTPRSSDGFGFVLCIYDAKPDLKSELRKYAVKDKINYRYWKSDKDTLNGKYSDEFRNSC